MTVQERKIQFSKKLYGVGLWSTYVLRFIQSCKNFWMPKICLEFMFLIKKLSFYKRFFSYHFKLLHFNFWSLILRLKICSCDVSKRWQLPKNVFFRRNSLEDNFLLKNARYAQENKGRIPGRAFMHVVNKLLNSIIHHLRPKIPDRRISVKL